MALSRPPASPLTLSVGGFPRMPVSAAHFAGAPLLMVTLHCLFSRMTGDPTPPGDVVVTSMTELLGNASEKRLAMVDAYTYAVVPTSWVANVISTGSVTV